MPHMYRTATVGEIRHGKALVVLVFLKSFGDIEKHRFGEEGTIVCHFQTF